MAQALLGVQLVGTFPISGRCSFARRFDFNFRVEAVRNIARFLVAGSEALGSARLGSAVPVIVDGLDTLEIHGTPGERWALKITVMLVPNDGSSPSTVVPAPKNHEDVIECDPYTKEI